MAETKAPEGKVYIALGPCCFGRGKTRSAAVRQAKKHMPTYMTWKLGQVLLATEDWAIDEFGRWSATEYEEVS